MSVLRFVLVAAVLFATVECAPFFDAIYDAINGNARRSYGYNGYGNYGYGGNPYGNGYDSGYGYGNAGYGGYAYKPRHEKQPPRQEKTFKDICRVHFPASADFPGRNGIVCPY
ncbi:unnamed protein product [Arctia plantaginis]|uniref:Uncharacterized protein n=1 Tax=Arctia plantaginis TaxID=874455 RepID=A0A8S1APA9_ARCPL|nr:unnamed protein product [Arctia plantaginis]